MVYVGIVGSANDLLVLDGARQRFVTFTTDGQYAGLSPTFRAGIPVRFWDDSVDMMIMDAMPSLKLREVVRVDIHSLGSRVLAKAGDSAYNALQSLSLRRLGVPPVATRRTGVVLGNTFAYEFQSYDSRGRPVASWGKRLAPRYLSDDQLDSAVAGATSEGEGQ
jgi:hypothetical protein